MTGITVIALMFVKLVEMSKELRLQSSLSQSNKSFKLLLDETG